MKAEPSTTPLFGNFHLKNDFKTLANISLPRKVHLVGRTNQEFLLCSEYDVMLDGVCKCMAAWYQASRFLAKAHHPFWSRAQITSMTNNCPYRQSTLLGVYKPTGLYLQLVISHHDNWEVLKSQKEEEHCRTFSPQTWFSITCKACWLAAKSSAVAATFWQKETRTWWWDLELPLWSP